MHSCGAIQVLTDLPSLPLKSKFSSNFTSLDNNLQPLEFKSNKKKPTKTQKVISEFADAENYPSLPYYQCIT